MPKAGEFFLLNILDILVFRIYTVEGLKCQKELSFQTFQIFNS